ncbi:M48 family metalloprotease [Patescibacteria group bacterium]|nr:M48 family metalloprotease [Patescibacteria group bacterium]
MATLYTQASTNTRKTWILMTGVFVLIIALGFLFSQVYNSPGILILAVLLSFFLNIVGYWYSDKIVLASTGAKEIQKKDNPELWRIVENLSIASGLPMPKLYIVPVAAPNAFATGRDKNHASVAVTEGLLEIMNKDELEGVIAHEISHIGNRDILVSTVVVVLVGVISIMADWFLRMSFWGGNRRNDNEGNNNIMFFLGIVGAILAPIAATLIQFAISRKRESLADASGALLTRYPEGLASALEKIENNPFKTQGASSATAHLYFTNPFKADRGDEKKTPFFVRLFMTHPPIEERIKVLREMSL